LYKLKEHDMSNFEVDIKSVRDLAALLTETGLNEIEYAEGERRIRCVRFHEPAPVQIAAPAQQIVAAASAEAAKQADIGTPVSSPMVGTVYLSPEPGSAAFVKVGDRVKEGETLLIIEAMKVMNPIKSPKSGEIAAILVSDAQPVEFGETLLTIV
jgi:acetyl-CoA carboxylase biotin carboxyl carrier protein